jgi:transcriptional regulator GlxA family with amidase domain
VGENLLRTKKFGLQGVVWLGVILSLASPSFAAEKLSGQTGILTAGFICTQGVFNTELTAPWDVLEHTRYRDSKNYIRCYLITEDGGALTTAEGLRIAADYSFAECPELDIVLIPSSEGSMGADLENPAFMGFLRERVEAASWVITLCDGAFPLAATGSLDGRVATTFPGDRDRFATMFPEIDVRYDLRFVVDGKFITSTGGAPSFEPAFYLVDELYGREHALRTAQGLVFPWADDEFPYLIVPAPR